MQKERHMGFFSSGVFWGAVVILLGISILLRTIFHIHLPIVRVLFGVFLLYMGIRIIAGGFWRGGWGYNGNSTVFGNANMKYDSDKRDYSIVFGNGTIDLSNIRSVIDDRTVEVNVVFGNGTVRVNDTIPVIVRSTTAFGNTVMPDRNGAAFGEMQYTSPSYVAGQPHLTIETNCVFGKITVQKSQW